MPTADRHIISPLAFTSDAIAIAIADAASRDFVALSVVGYLFSLPLPTCFLS